jgi:hypothetical protein
MHWSKSIHSGADCRLWLEQATSRAIDETIAGRRSGRSRWSWACGSLGWAVRCLHVSGPRAQRVPGVAFRAKQRAAIFVPGERRPPDLRRFWFSLAIPMDQYDPPRLHARSPSIA